MNDKQKKTLNTAVISIILVSIWALFFITGISSFPLYPPDEPKYANAAYNMLDSGDFLTPFLQSGTLQIGAIYDAIIVISLREKDFPMNLH